MLCETIQRPQPDGTARGVHRASARRVLEWLTPEEAILDATLRDRRHALEIAATSIGRRRHIDPASVLRALWRREHVGSTAFGCGVAIPHARVIGLEHPVTLFLRATPPIDFRAPDGKPVESILAIAVPAEGNADDHLLLLALLASMLSDRAFRARLAAETNAAGIRGAFADPNPEFRTDLKWKVRHNFGS